VSGRFSIVVHRGRFDNELGPLQTRNPVQEDYPDRYPDVRSLRVVISDVLDQNAVQMALIENNQAIQTLFPDRPHPVFGYNMGRYSKLTKCAGVVLR
jgi:hypothetical protein